MQPHPVRAVLFDYGLVLTGPPHPQAWADMQTITGLDPSAFDRAYWAERLAYDRGKLTGRAYWAGIVEAAGRTPRSDELAALIAADTRLWTVLNQPMIDWALRLQAAGTPTGILSNLGDEMTQGVLATHAWLAGFTHRLWSHTLGIAKPEPSIYRHAAEGLGMQPAAILFVDDREDNIAGALRAGMQAIRYGEQAAFEDELDRRGLGALWQTGMSAGQRG